MPGAGGTSRSSTTCPGWRSSRPDCAPEHRLPTTPRPYPPPLPKPSIDAEFYELEAGRHVLPDRVWCGDHLVTERREVLRQFANGIDAHKRRAHRAFLASVRVLGEGVDITGERGVEAIS
ncbi:hypothetical protein GCM10017750_68390 [Streptomyces racemochromogenes]